MRARIEEESSKNSTEVSKTKVGDSNVSNPKVISHEMLLTQKTLLHTLHEEQPSYLLLCQVILTCLSSSSLKDLLPSIVALLQEFQDPFSKDGPRGLPPFRGIKHQIDFFPGASIPDRPMYRTNPIKTKEIESQVNELLDKGWVQNSLSPCDIHVLLVSKKDGKWCMCCDCRAINNITIKYRHPIPRLDDMLDGYHQSEIKKEMNGKLISKLNLVFMNG